jgi:4-hydroxy-tetrahydrodipicolinate reductase
LVVECAERFGVPVTGAVSSDGAVSLLFNNADAIIDFSAPEATVEMLKLALHRRSMVPIVIGTTGLGKVHEELITSCAGYAPIFHSPNMSVVVAILNELVGDVAKALGPDEFDVEILEAHHKLKKDAPSGTALMLGHSVASARDQIFQDVAQFDRVKEATELRKHGEIGFAVIRGGSIVGMHDVSFNGEFERLSLRHEALDAGIFATGAVKIARWIVDNHLPPGRYTMNDYVHHILNTR